MLKIWLNWLQPSLGVLGVVLVLSNAVSAHAASKAKETNKLPKGNSQPQVAKPSGFTIPQMTGAFSPSRGISLPPDVAIRRLALDTIANSETKSPNLDTQASQRDRGNILRLTSSPAPKSTSADFVKHSLPQQLSSTGVYSPSSTAAPLVPGLFIGRSTGNAARFSPSIQPVLAPVAKAVAVPISTPKVVASAVVATPFPVMLPEQMPQFNTVQTVATEKASPIVARTTRSNITVASGLQNILGGESSSQTGRGFDTAVASGLQNVLGTEPKAIQSESMVALSKVVAPESKPLPPSTRGTLQLATSQSYVSAPEFDLPGVVASEPVVKSAQLVAKVVPVKNIRKDLSTAVIQRKSDYVALMSDKKLELPSRSSWQSMSRSHSLGGLILGSRSRNEDEIAALPMKAIKASNYGGLGIFNPPHQY